MSSSAHACIELGVYFHTGMSYSKCANVGLLGLASNIVRHFSIPPQTPPTILP